jgi:hypothetical protein
VSDYFAAAQFADLSEDEKLSRPGFEEMASGGTAGVPRYRWPVDAQNNAVRTVATLSYDEAVMNADEPLTQVRTGVPFNSRLGAALARDGAAGHSMGRTSTLATPQRQIAVIAERYVAGPMGTLPGASAATSYARAAAGMGPGERVLTEAEVS